MRRLISTAALAAAATFAFACSGDAEGTNDTGVDSDTSSDIGGQDVDAADDVVLDAEPDVELDVAVDAAADTIADAVSDTELDASTDTVDDAQTDPTPDSEDTSLDIVSDPTVDTQPPDTGLSECASAADVQGWQLCSETADTCAFVFADSTGCTAVCAEAGLRCVAAFEDQDGVCAPNDTLPELSCAGSGHISDYCVCGEGVEPPSEVLAFPSARGAGAYATGGRGGRTIRVTSLADSGPGTLREALSAEGSRIITFAIAGQIVLESTLRVRNGDFTLAGQTAPVGGITLTGVSRIMLVEDTDNFVIRYLRFRPEYSGSDAVEMINSTNFIVDHVSMSWGSDETMSTRGVTNAVTFQRNIFAEGKTGSLFGDSNDPTLSHDLSFHHNAFYNISHRFPNVHVLGRADVYNNLAFNWKYRWSVVIGDVQLNHINNYYANACLGSVNHFNSFNKVFYNASHVPEIYSAGNYVTDFLTDPAADNWGLWSWRVDVNEGPYAGAIANTQLTTDYQIDTPFELLGPATTAQPASVAFNDITADVGANARIDESGAVIAEVDAIDAMYIENILAGDCVAYMAHSSGYDFDQTAHYVAFHASTSSTPTGTGYADANQDGIPDAWALTHGLTVDQDVTSYVWPSGYVGVEEYLNEIDR